MRQRFERIAFFSGFFAILLTLGAMLFQKEKILREGQVIILKLAPKDPRSLLMGDYMSITYEILQDLSFPGKDGFILVDLLPDQSVRVHSLHEVRPEVGEAQAVLAFRQRDKQFRISADRFFFQEGRSAHFAQAQYAELRANRNGEALLVQLLDERRAPLGRNEKLR